MLFLLYYQINQCTLLSDQSICDTLHTIIPCMWLDTLTFIVTSNNTHSVNDIPQRCLIDPKRLLLVDPVSIEICY